MSSLQSYNYFLILHLDHIFGVYFTYKWFQRILKIMCNIKTVLKNCETWKILSLIFDSELLPNSYISNCISKIYYDIFLKRNRRFWFVITLFFRNLLMVTLCRVFKIEYNKNKISAVYIWKTWAHITYGS